MANGVFHHEEGHTLPLSCSKTLGGFMGQVWEASTGISKYLRHDYMPKWSESILTYYSAKVGPSRHGKWSVVTQGWMDIVPVVFQNTWWVHGTGTGLRSTLWHPIISEALIYAQMSRFNWLVFCGQSRRQPSWPLPVWQTERVITEFFKCIKWVLFGLLRYYCD